MNRSIQAFAFAIILLGLTATRARADLAISLSNVSLAPGGTGTMDINVTSTSGDTLSAFGLELQITSPGIPTAFLQFSPLADQPDPYSNSNPPYPYVFSGASFKSDYVLPFWFQVTSPFVLPPDISGGDASDSNQGYVSIPSGSSAYLATVQFFDPGGTPGDQFQISLVSGVNTYFDDLNGNPLNYTSTGGTVTITSVVPEPSSLTVVALSGLSGLLWCCWRGRKHGLLKNSPVATPFPPTDPAVLP